MDVLQKEIDEVYATQLIADEKRLDFRMDQIYLASSKS